MGLFKTREEREAEKIRRMEEAEKLKQRIYDSPLTKTIQMFLLEQFGDINSSEIAKLRELSRGGRRGGYIMTVQYNGIVFNLINYKGESLNKAILTFDSLGFENLPGGTDTLQKILLQTLSEIPHLKVLDTGFFMYNENRAKQSW